jgi:hypothetical protein
VLEADATDRVPLAKGVTEASRMPRPAIWPVVGAVSLETADWIPTTTTQNKSATCEQQCKFSDSAIGLTGRAESNHSDDEANEGDGKEDKAVASIEAPAALKHACQTGLGLTCLLDVVRGLSEVGFLRLRRDGDNMQLVTKIAGDEAIAGRLGLR